MKIVLRRTSPTSYLVKAGNLSIAAVTFGHDQKWKVGFWEMFFNKLTDEQQEAVRTLCTNQLTILKITQRLRS